MLPILKKIIKVCYANFDIYDAYEEFGKALHTEGGPLEEKQRWQVKVAVSAACRHELALKTHIIKALNAGCTPEEIEHAILLTASTAGFPTMMTALMSFREELEG
ncbi:MAG: carboxymuconolactone decarboxylase family protein [Bacteroidetes bacterium]|nr:carboxymuconolactone decarboxylase family protein [Bacteroidota bacterium]